MPLLRAAVAECIGTAFLLMAVVGSGIMADRLSEDTGLVLFQNAFATAAALLALILTFAAASGAHFNPAVTLAQLALRSIGAAQAGIYVAAQVVGGIIGVITANVMFELDAVNWSTTDRSDPALVFAEVIATIGLLLVIHGVVRSSSATDTGAEAQIRTSSVALAVAGYIGAAYYFTSSTSFANPAVTIARTMSDTFAGIAPSSAPAFIGAQLGGAVVAVVIIRFIWPEASTEASTS